MTDRKELIDDFMEVFQMFALKVQETDQSCVEMAAANDITKYDLALIGHIGKKGEVIMREIADYVDVPYSTATGIIDKLVKKKLVKRVNSETDRRTVKVALTPKKGKELFDQFMNFRHKLGEIVLSNMDERDFSDIERIMKKMVRQISDHNVESQLREELTAAKI
ncbi:MAG TPA: MarR family winged helix-turn-helix transcriptional regulator [Cyclobacteriaceae bacterium]|nr:MarR family winged helix-turn-helix transcriptional regulator [Cyclobacteriaceae bacterium]